MTTFIVENVSVPPEVEQAIDKRSSMAAVGNLNDYVKYQMAQGMEKGGSGGAGGIGGRDGGRHGDGAADDESAGRHDGADDAGHRRRRRAGDGGGAPELHEPGAGRADARRRAKPTWSRASRPATSRARRSARSGA